jgi:hypothetical protein
MTFLSLLHENFNPQRLLLENQKKQQALFMQAHYLLFLLKLKNIRESNGVQRPFLLIY